MQNSNKILIFGSGQIGSALARELGKRALQINRDQCDFEVATEADFQQILEKYKPSAIINCAAYTAVDLAEDEGRVAAFRINAEAVGMLARAAVAFDIPLVHYSTDYVFDGNGAAPWAETDGPDPLNSYGASKLAGEQEIQSAGGKYLLFRISWVYDERGRNFLNTMLKLGAEQEELKVVSDQIGAPCYAADIAAATLEVLAKAKAMHAFPSGIYHVCNRGETSWNGFAKEIFRLARAEGAALKIRDVASIATSEYPTPAKRPLNSRLNCEKLRTTFGVVLPDWQDALGRCIRDKYAG